MGIFSAGSGTFAPGAESPQQQAIEGNWTRQSGQDFTGRSGTGTGPSGMAAYGSFSGNRTSGATVMNGGSQGMGTGFGGDESTGRLAEYLLAHTSGETWILAVASSHNGADLIIETAKPVMCLGGFTGSDQVLNVSTLKQYISEGKVRYFLGSASGDGGGPDGGNIAIFSWVSQNCAGVPAEDWGGTTDTSARNVSPLSGNLTAAEFPDSGSTTSRTSIGTGSANTLYDCAVYRGQAGT